MLSISDQPGRAAGRLAAELIASAVEEQGKARVIFASAPSQEEMLESLCSHGDIDWSRVESFHMDEYLGLPMDDSRAFGQWLLDRLPIAAHGGFHRLDSRGETTSEIRRYESLLAASAVDLTCLGVGMNGHVAFNEPGQVDFHGEQLVKAVELDPVSREQQVTEGLFERIEDVPSHALSLTFRALVDSRALVCTVLGSHKARAVAAALEGPLSEQCPASGLRLAADVSWFLDEDAASELSVRATGQC